MVLPAASRGANKLTITQCTNHVNFGFSFASYSTDKYPGLESSHVSPLTPIQMHSVWSLATLSREKCQLISAGPVLWVCLSNWRRHYIQENQAFNAQYC